MASLTPNQFRNLPRLEQVELETFVLLQDLKEVDLAEKKLAAKKKAAAIKAQRDKEAAARKAARGGGRR